MRITTICFAIVFFFSQSVFGDDGTTDLQARISNLEAKVNALQRIVDELRSPEAADAIRGTNPSPVADNTGGVPGLSGTFSMDHDFVKCPAGTFVAGIQGFTLNGPLYALRYLCRKL